MTIYENMLKLIAGGAMSGAEGSDGMNFDTVMETAKTFVENVQTDLAAIKEQQQQIIQMLNDAAALREQAMQAMLPPPDPVTEDDKSEGGDEKSKSK
jgi:hypothetical protein